mmetsp:Transcript_45454/g.89534  ORF Transcript_45454/g.89534 Transcript_45454/m.89534 type:complete len:113 (-) Transcript_45454:83-421(-)
MRSKALFMAFAGGKERKRSVTDISQKGSCTLVRIKEEGSMIEARQSFEGCFKGRNVLQYSRQRPYGVSKNLPLYEWKQKSNMGRPTLKPLVMFLSDFLDSSEAPGVPGNNHH